MKILFIVNNLSVGGAGRVVAQLASMMVKLGNEVNIIITVDSPILYKIDDSIKVDTLLTEGMIESTNPIKRIYDRANIIRKFCRNNNIEIVYAFLPEINIYAILAGVGQKWTTIISERNDPNIDPPYKRVRLLRRILYPFCDGAVFQTEEAKNYFSSRIQKKGIVIFNPVSESIPDVFEGERKKRFVAAGRLNEQKNYPMMIMAFANVLKRYPEYSLDIYGAGEEFEKIKSLINSLNCSDNIILKGQSYSLWENILDAKGYLLSSDYEGMSNSLIEAMCLGIPVISTDHPVGGARALIKHGENGLLVQTGNVKELEMAIIRIIEDDFLAEKLSRNAKLIRERLSIDCIAGQWISFAEKCIKRR